MIHVLLGTKAQLIKMAPVMHGLASAGLDYNFIFTGQHHETMDALRDNFQVKEPDIVLYEGKDITTLSAMGLWFLKCLYKGAKDAKRIFRSDRSGIVLVHGDTFSTLLGAVMGRMAHLHVGHVESGLRSFRWFHPFPEELTRLATFNLADHYFCPGQWALDNLAPYRGTKINTRHNTLLDALTKALANPEPLKISIPDNDYAVVSTHRYENLKNRALVVKLVETIEHVARYISCLFVLHPVTRNALEHYGLYERMEKNPRIDLQPRHDYFDFIKLVHASRFMVTDGGSNQEECYYMGKPCLLLRHATERKEGLGENAVLSGFDPEVVDEFCRNSSRYERPSFATDDRAGPSDMIVNYVRRFA